jgi:hypothetical protein
MDTLVSKKPPSGAGPRKPTKETKASHKTLIARHLKLVYDDIALEQLPQNLQDLLSQIDETEVKS